MVLKIQITAKNFYDSAIKDEAFNTKLFYLETKLSLLVN